MKRKKWPDNNWMRKWRNKENTKMDKLKVIYEDNQIIVVEKWQIVPTPKWQN